MSVFTENTNHGRIPHVAKLMALATHFDQLIRDGVVADYADRRGWAT